MDVQNVFLLLPIQRSDVNRDDGKTPTHQANKDEASRANQDVIDKTMSKVKH
jgi:hypothetical protein